MKPEIILDEGWGQQIQDYLSEKEGIEWEGSPNPKFSITLLESEGYYDVRTGPTSTLGFILGGMAIGGYLFYTHENWMGFILTMLIGLGLIASPDIVKHIRKKKTRYAFTKNRVFFKLWRWGKERVHIIDLADIVKITWQEYEDKSGTAHFFTNKPPGFYTYDFVTGRRRDYPTFEMVPDVIELTSRLESLRKERIKHKADADKAERP